MSREAIIEAIIDLCKSIREAHFKMSKAEFAEATAMSRGKLADIEAGDHLPDGQYLRGLEELNYPTDSLRKMIREWRSLQSKKRDEWEKAKQDEERLFQLYLRHCGTGIDAETSLKIAKTFLDYYEENKNFNKKTNV